MPHAPLPQQETSEISKYRCVNNEDIATNGNQAAQQMWEINAATLSGTTGKYLAKEFSLWRMSKANGQTAQPPAAHDLQSTVTSTMEVNSVANWLTLCSLGKIEIPNQDTGNAYSQPVFPLKRQFVWEGPGDGKCKETALPNDAAEDWQRNDFPQNNHINENAITLSAVSGGYLQKELLLWQTMRGASQKNSGGTSELQEPLSPPIRPLYKRYRKQENEEGEILEGSAVTLSGSTGRFLAKELQNWRQLNSGSPRFNCTSTPNPQKGNEVSCPASEQSTDEDSNDERPLCNELGTISPLSSLGWPAMDHIHVPRMAPEVDALMFDIDDTLYTVSSGFSDHRNAEVTVKFLVEEVGFASYDGAKLLRDEYFQRYHSTLKGLAIASREGKLPRPFNELELGEYWSQHCDFEKYLKPDPLVIEALRTLRDDAGLTLVAFTNSPVKYALRCLDFLGLRGIFADKNVFGIEDVLPASKPEQIAFEKVLNAAGLRADRTVMFEDSMKNIKACKAMGMHTVLVSERAGGAAGGEAALLDDLPSPDDPAVDVVVRRISQMRMALPSLWSKHF